MLKQIVRNHPSRFITAFERKCLSTFVISTTLTGLGTPYDGILAVT